MLKLVGALVLALAFLVPNATPARAVGSSDQQVVGNQNAFCTGTNAVAGQTFTAGITGLLDQLDIFVTRVTVPPTTITVQIRDAVGNLPGPTVPASRAVTIPNVAVGFNVRPPVTSVTFPVPASVVAGTQYAFVFECTGQQI